LQAEWVLAEELWGTEDMKSAWRYRPFNLSISGSDAGEQTEDEANRSS